MKPTYGSLTLQNELTDDQRLQTLLGAENFRSFPIRQEEVASFLEKRAFSGITVSPAFRQAVIPHLDYLSSLAFKAGTVDTVLNRGGKLIGRNSAYSGFASLIRRSRIYIKNKKVLLVGSSPDKSTVCAVLRDFGASELCEYEQNGSDKDTEILILFSSAEEISLSSFPKLTGVIDFSSPLFRPKAVLEAEERKIRATSGKYMQIAQASAAHASFFGASTSPLQTEALYRQMRNESLNILLVGMPGCGKSTIGLHLSQLTGRQVYDTDRLCEKKIGMSASDFLRKNAVKEFRSYETQTLAEVAGLSGGVISTGGGIVTMPENLPLLRQNSFVLFLNRPLSKLSTYNRPLSSTPEALRRLLDERLPLYRKVCDREISDSRDAGAFFATAPKKALRLFEEFDA